MRKYISFLKTQKRGVDVLIGADGTNSQVAVAFDVERKTTRGRLSLGVTCNFHNTNSEAEKNMQQRGIVRNYDQGWFNALEKKTGIYLDDYVYFREETHHYFVMTARLTSLISRGVVKDGPETIKEKIDKRDVKNLEEFVKDVAMHCGLPADKCKLLNGVGDLALFDFSTRTVCTEQAKVIMTNRGAQLLVIMIGDALVEPFWPQGTGANRSILSAMDSAWIVKSYYKKGRLGQSLLPNQPTPDNLASKWMKIMKKLVVCQPADLVTNSGSHTIDPRTRYKNLFY